MDQKHFLRISCLQTRQQKCREPETEGEAERERWKVSSFRKLHSMTGVDAFIETLTSDSPEVYGYVYLRVPTEFKSYGEKGNWIGKFVRVKTLC